MKFINWLKKLWASFNVPPTPEIVLNKPVIPILDTYEKLTADVVRKTFLSNFLKFQGQAEVNGQNRSEWIDSINKWIGEANGAPYCATSISLAIDVTEKQLNIKIAVPKTSSSQSMFFKSPVQNRVPVPSSGMIAILYNYADQNHGHALVCTGVVGDNGLYPTAECNIKNNTEPMQGCQIWYRHINGVPQVKGTRGFLDVGIGFIDLNDVHKPVDTVDKIDATKPDWTLIAPQMELDKDKDKLKYIDQVIAKILSLRGRYEAVQAKTNVPWYFIASLHFMEASNRMNGNMLNGQPINQVTTIVPIGRGAWATWEDSAIEAFTKYSKENNWTLAKMLSVAEAYNGFGYRKYSKLSPYVAAFTNMSDEKGGYPRDHYYDVNYVHDRPSVGALLIAMRQKKIVDFKTV